MGGNPTHPGSVAPPTCGQLPAGHATQEGIAACGGREQTWPESRPHKWFSGTTEHTWRPVCAEVSTLLPGDWVRTGESVGEPETAEPGVWRGEAGESSSGFPRAGAPQCCGGPPQALCPSAPPCRASLPGSPETAPTPH